MHYFFHLHECGKVTRDHMGAELVDLAAAHMLAVKEARIVMCSEVKRGFLCLDCHIDIADDDGRSLATVRFEDAVMVTGGAMAGTGHPVSLG